MVAGLHNQMFTKVLLNKQQRLCTVNLVIFHTRIIACNLYTIQNYLCTVSDIGYFELCNLLLCLGQQVYFNLYIYKDVTYVQQISQLNCNDIIRSYCTLCIYGVNVHKSQPNVLQF